MKRETGGKLENEEAVCVGGWLFIRRDVLWNFMVICQEKMGGESDGSLAIVHEIGRRDPDTWLDPLDRVLSCSGGSKGGGDWVQ